MNPEGIISSLPIETDFVSADIFKAAKNNNEILLAAIEPFIDSGGIFNAFRFGHFLRKYDGRTVRGRRITKRRVNRDGIIVWRVEPVEDQDQIPGDLADIIKSVEDDWVKVDCATRILEAVDNAGDDPQKQILAVRRQATMWLREANPTSRADDF